jgi:hypothetical protein
MLLPKLVRGFCPTELLLLAASDERRGDCLMLRELLAQCALWYVIKNMVLLKSKRAAFGSIKVT